MRKRTSFRKTSYILNDQIAALVQFVFLAPTIYLTFPYKIIKPRYIRSQLLLMVLLLPLVSGCASDSMYRRYNRALAHNTSRLYNEFIKKYPDTSPATDFQKRLNDPDYAFIATCLIGTKRAFEGFIKTHPLSPYVPICKDRIDYLTTINMPYHMYTHHAKPNDTKFFELNKLYISEHPENPFVIESKARLPIIWLREISGKIGIEIEVGEVIRGKLLKRNRDIEKVKQDIFQKAKDVLASEGIESVFINGSQGSNELRHLSAIIVIYYSEKPPTGYDIGLAMQTPGLLLSSANLYNAAAMAASSGPLIIIGVPALLVAGAITGLVSNPTKRIFGVSHKYIWIDIKGVQNHVNYYSGLRSFFSIYRQITSDQLSAIGWDFNPLQYMVMTLVRSYRCSVEPEKVSPLDIYNSKMAESAFSCSIGLYPYYDLLKSLPMDRLLGSPKNTIQETNLLIAAAYNDFDLVQSLLSKGANVNIKAVSGVTPLMWASFNGNNKIVDALLNNGADFNAKGRYGETALIIASGRGYSDVVNELLNWGANVNDKDIEGRTALMWAAEGGHVQVVESLLTRGADVNAKDNRGWNALRWATMANSDERSVIEQLLKAAGGRQ